MLVLSTHGARSGLTRDVALLYYRQGSDFYVVASNGGRAEHPAWLANVRAHPTVRVRVGGDRFCGAAHVLDAHERDVIWSTLVRAYPGWAHYQTLTTRVIEVVTITCGA